MSKRHDQVRRLPSEPDRDVVAEAATRLLREADRALEGLRAEAEHVRGAADDAKTRIEDLRIDVGADVRDDHARIAEISRDLERMHGRLEEIDAAIIGLQTQSLRQTGAAALALAVMLAIAWKVIGG